MTAVDRAARAATLTVEHVDGERYAVRGGKSPHLVDFNDAHGILCDCKDREFHPGIDCAHILAVQRFRGNGHPAATTADATAHRPRFHLYTPDELLALPPAAWLVAGHLPENGLGVIYGPPGAAKTFLGIAWAMAIATGQPWLGHATRRGSVIYVAAEGSSGLAQRVQAYRDANELSGPVDVRFVCETINLLQTGDVGALLADVDAALAEHPALFVFDTLARMIPGGDENSAQDVGLAIAAADRIRRETNAAVVFVHHTQKSGELERGSSALRGAADAMFALRNDEGLLTLECTKQKDAPAIDARRLRLVAVDPSCVIEPVEGESTPKMTATAWKLLRELAETFEGGGSSMAAWVRVSSVSERTVMRTAKLLKSMGYVSQDARRYVVTPAGVSALKVAAT